MYLKDLIPSLERKSNDLNQECTLLEEHVKSYNQRLSLYDELQNMRFGLKELKLLRNTINEIAYANNIPADQAQQNHQRRGDPVRQEGGELPGVRLACIDQHDARLNCQNRQTSISTA